MSAWLAGDERRKLFAVAAAAVLAATVAYALILRNLYFGAHAVTAIDDFGEAVAAAIACVACAWAARRSSGNDRVGWALLSVSAALWGAGEVAWATYEVFLRIDVPSPSLADVGFLASVPFALVGIRAFWSHARGTPEKLRVWFDGIIVALALTSTAWGFGLRAVVESHEALAAKLLNLAYPVSDILVGTVLILAIRRATHQQKARMALLLTGIGCYSIADSAFSYLTAQNAFGAVGNVIDTGWFAGFLLIALAAMYPVQPAKEAHVQNRLDLWQLALPWMTLLTASAGDVFSALTGHELDLFMSSLTATLAVLLTVNMVIERREFLEMLTEIQSGQLALDREFKAALVDIRRWSAAIETGSDVDEARRLGREVHEAAGRLDRLVEELLAGEGGSGGDHEVAAAPGPGLALGAPGLAAGAPTR